MRIGDPVAARLVALSDASDAAAQNNLGVVLQNAGRPAEAQGAFMRAIALDGGMSVARANLHGIPAEVSAAAASSRWADVRADASDDDAWRAVVRHHGARGELALAAAALERWETVRGGATVAAAAERARVALEAGRPDAALAALARARTLAADRPATGHHAALVASFDLIEARAAYQRGDTARALAAVERTRATMPDDPEAELLRSFVLGELGDVDAAAASRARAAALDPALGRVEAGLEVDPGAASRGGAGRPNVSLGPSAPVRGVAGPSAREAQQTIARATAARHRAYYDDAMHALTPLVGSSDPDRRAAALAAVAAVHLQRGAAAAAIPALSAAIEAVRAANACVGTFALALSAAKLVTGDLAGSDAAARSAAAEEGASPLVRAGALSTRALVAWRTGDLARARAGLLDAAVQARTLDPSVRAALAANLALLLAETGAHVAAVAAGAAAVRLAPIDAAAHSAYARAAADAGQYAAARDAYARACAIDPHDAVARYGLAFASGACGDRAVAQRELARATALSPIVRGASPRVIVDADGPLLLPGDGTAVRTPARALAAAGGPDTADAGRAEYAHVDARLAAGEYERALAAADAALARGASPREGLLLAGHALAKSGRPAAALERYRRAATAGPSDPDAEVHVLRTLHRLGRLDEACERGRAAVDRWPTVPAFASLLARAAADRGSIDLATDALARCAQTRPAEALDGAASGEAAAFWADVACAWQALGAWRAAADAWAEAARAVPSVATPALARARALARAGDPDAAEVVLETVAAAAPDLPDVWRARAEIAAAAGRPSTAGAHLARVLHHDGGDVDALAALAAAFVDTARADDAREAASRALSLEPDHPLALAVAGDCAATQDARVAQDFWNRALAASPVGVGAARARRGLRRRANAAADDAAQSAA